MEEDIKKVEEVKTPVAETTQSPVQEAVQPKPKKKGKGCLVAFLIFFIIIISLGVFVYFKIKSVIANIGTQRDLGIAYTQQDYDNFQEKLEISDVPEENVCIGCPAASYSNAKEVEVVISSQEASAAFDIVNQNMPVGSIKNTQIKFSDDLIEISTILTYEGQTFPVYVAGNIEKASSNTITGDVQNVMAGSLDIPGNINGSVENGLLGIFNDSLASLGDTLRIDTLKITDEGLVFKGLVPTNIK